jgi:hypothetical protein
MQPNLCHNCWVHLMVHEVLPKSKATQTTSAAITVPTLCCCLHLSPALQLPASQCVHTATFEGSCTSPHSPFCCRPHSPNLQQHDQGADRDTTSYGAPNKPARCLLYAKSTNIVHEVQAHKSFGTSSTTKRMRVTTAPQRTGDIPLPANLDEHMPTPWRTSYLHQCPQSKQS